MGNFNPLIYVEDNTAGHNKSRKFPEFIDYNFLTQLIRLIRGVLLGIILL